MKLTWNLYSKGSLRRTRLTIKDKPELYAGEFSIASTLHLQPQWLQSLGVSGDMPSLIDVVYDDVSCAAIIDSLTNDYGIHIVKFTNRPLWRFSDHIVFFTAYLLLRKYDFQSDYGVIYRIDPYNKVKVEKRVVNIEPVMFAEVEQRLYNLTHRYKLLFTET